MEKMNMKHVSKILKVYSGQKNKLAITTLAM